MGKYPELETIKPRKSTVDRMTIIDLEGLASDSGRADVYLRNFVARARVVANNHSWTEVGVMPGNACGHGCKVYSRLDRNNQLLTAILHESAYGHAPGTVNG